MKSQEESTVTRRSVPFGQVSLQRRESLWNEKVFFHEEISFSSGMDFTTALKGRNVRL